MKASKYLVLLGGIIGVVAFFLPAITVKNDDVTVKISSYRIVRGVDDAAQVVDKKSAAAAAQESAAHPDDARAIIDTANASFKSIRTPILIIFAPAVLLLVFGGIATARGRFGRFGGFSAFVVGGLCAAVWMLAHHVNQTTMSNDPAPLGIGVHLLLASGAAGILGGLLAMISPDRGMD